MIGFTVNSKRDNTVQIILFMRFNSNQFYLFTVNFLCYSLTVTSSDLKTWPLKIFIFTQFKVELTRFFETTARSRDFHKIMLSPTKIDHHGYLLTTRVRGVIDSESTLTVRNSDSESNAQSLNALRFIVIAWKFCNHECTSSNTPPKIIFVRNRYVEPGRDQ